MERAQSDTPDLVLRCVDCGAGFTVTPGEAEFYRDRQLRLPKRCVACRKARRQAIERPNPEPGLDRFDPTGRWRDLYPKGKGGQP